MPNGLSLGRFWYMSMLTHTRLPRETETRPTWCLNHNMVWLVSGAELVVGGVYIGCATVSNEAANFWKRAQLFGTYNMNFRSLRSISQLMLSTWLPRSAVCTATWRPIWSSSELTCQSMTTSSPCATSTKFRRSSHAFPLVFSRTRPLTQLMRPWSTMVPHTPPTMATPTPSVWLMWWTRDTTSNMDAR